MWELKHDQACYFLEACTDIFHKYTFGHIFLTEHPNLPRPRTVPAQPSVLKTFNEHDFNAFEKSKKFQIPMFFPVLRYFAQSLTYACKMCSQTITDG